MKIDWVRKLTSRKFWVAVAEFATGLIIAFGGTEEVALKVTGLIMSGAAMIAYIIGEGLVDAANAGVIEYQYEVEDQPPDNVEEND